MCFIYLSLVGLIFVATCRLFSSCGEQQLFSVAFHLLLIAVASLVLEHGLSGTQASGAEALWLSCSMACRTS